jgi:hypothetical protein
MECLAFKRMFKAPRIFASAVLAVFVALALDIPSRPAYAVALEDVSFHGYMDFLYKQNTKAEAPDDPNAPNPTNGSFDFRHLTFLADIHVMPELWIKTNVEFDHTPDTELGHGGIIMEFGFAEYLVKDWLKLRAGKSLTPYGIFNEVHDASPTYLSVNVPEIVYKADTRGGFALIPKWVTGVSALGNTAPCNGCEFDYVVYVGNGESVGVNEGQYDSNHNKAVGGRAQMSFNDEQFLAGFSAFYDEKAVSQTQLTENHWAYLISLNYNLSALNLKAEYGQSKLGSRTESVWYAQSSYRMGRHIPYLRVQGIDPNDTKPADYWNAYSVGLNVQVNKHMFLKFEWTENRRGENNTDIITPGNEDFGEFKSAMTIYF